MAKITLNGIDALTESGGTVTVAAGTNLVLGTGAVPTSAIADDAVTGAKIENNPTIAGNLTVAGTSTLTGATTLSSTLAVVGNATFSGDLIVNGTTTTVNSTTLTIDDKNIELAHSPSGSEGNDASVDGGGITLKSSDSDKTILWENDTDSWNFSENIETLTNKKIIQRGEAFMKSLHRSWVMGG